MYAEGVNSGVRSVEIALDILETIAFSEEEIGVSQIAARLGLAKGAAFRHLQTLVERGYLVQNPATARYQIGVRFRLLGRLGRLGSDLYTASEGPMTDLRNAVGETVVLSAPEQNGPRVLATMPGRSLVEIGVRPGSVLQFGASAQGKVMLAFGQPELRERIARLQADAKSAAGLEREIARARRQGWLDSPGEVMRGINAIAAPLFDASAHCVGAIALVGLFELTPRSRNEALAVALQRAAERISLNLGSRHPGIARDASAPPPVAAGTAGRRRQSRDAT